MLIRFDERDFLIGIGVLCALLPVFWWRKRSFSYLLFFSVFWVYLLMVVRTVIFPIAINVDYSSPRIMPRINLIPFYFSYCAILRLCIMETVGNVILTIPLGFGINFLVQVKSKKLLLLALAIGLGFEFSQLLISLAFRSGFRTIDINDVMLNFIGVLIGYELFKAFAWTYIKAAEYFGISYKCLFADIYDIALRAQ